MQKFRIITLNGPLQCGKSWTTKQLAAAFKLAGIQPILLDFKDPLIDAVYALLGLPKSTDYESFKVTEYSGVSGRQWLIAMSEILAKPYGGQSFFAESLVRRIRNTPNASAPRVVIAESNGFPIELAYLRAQEDIDLLAITIEPPDSPPPGELWTVGDSRFNLAHMANIVGRDSNEAKSKALHALQNRGWL